MFDHHDNGFDPFIAFQLTKQQVCSADSFGTQYSDRITYEACGVLKMHHRKCFYRPFFGPSLQGNANQEEEIEKEFVHTLKYFSAKVVLSLYLGSTHFHERLIFMWVNCSDV